MRTNAFDFFFSSEILSSSCEELGNFLPHPYRGTVLTKVRITREVVRFVVKHSNSGPEWYVDDADEYKMRIETE